MATRPASSGRLAAAGWCIAMFTIALSALVSSQLALMSILDPARAALGADQIATSAFTADLIEQAVERAVGPIAGDDIAAQLARAASSDTKVTDVISTSLLGAHQLIVDPDVRTATGGNVAVHTAIARAVLDAASSAGVDPVAHGLDATGVDQLPLSLERAELPSVVPTDVPSLGLGRLAEVTRAVALCAALILALVGTSAHPRLGQALRRLGGAVAITCAAWLVSMLVVGWIIRLISNTLFGEMLQTVWSDAVPAMLLMLGAGAVIGLGVVIAGAAFDGWSAQRAPRVPDTPRRAR